MIPNLIDGICGALYKEFGYEIYTEPVEQSLREPCFRVRCLSAGQNRRLGRCYENKTQFSIQYFGGNSLETQERLFDVLETINVQNQPRHGSGLSGVVVDEVLTVTVSYDGFILKDEAEIPNMDNLDMTQKGG